jgi:cyclopropane fatty-acyl-phospholipid synthase-like methyltransferase
MSNEAVRRYYQECHVDYRVVWRLEQNLSIHFGYFDRHCTEHAEALANMNRAMLKRTSIAPADRVLDAGCGVGGSAFWIAEQTGATVTGANIQPLHLEIAREECARRGLVGRVSFEERDYCATGLEPESFDVVWALESVCHCEDKRKFLAEAYRLLRPGGRLIVGDFIGFREDLSPSQARAMKIWLDGWAIPHLAGFERFRETMAQVGFAEIAAENITPNVLRSSRRLFKASLLALPFSGFATWMGWRSRGQTANVRASYHQYKTIRAGYWGYAIYSAVKPAADQTS